MRRLSDEALLAGLNRALGSSRKLMAVVIAHLGEVEERRLALLAGHESMFAYCTRRLGMSEDEACRRIEVARLARRFPVLFEQLADGRISLSVAALLKAHLDETNHLALLAAVSGKSVARAREVLAAWFPRPDVAASIRKLPARSADGASSDAPGSDGPGSDGAVGSDRASGAESNPPSESAAAGQTSDAPSQSPGRTANTSTDRHTRLIRPPYPWPPSARPPRRRHPESRL